MAQVGQVPWGLLLVQPASFEAEEEDAAAAAVVHLASVALRPR